MNPVLRNVLAVVAGVVVGMFINGGIIAMSSSVIPPPAGADVTTMEGLKASLHLFEPRHFIMPFLAHALGTLAGAFLAAKLAVGNSLRLALVVAVVFLIGGIANVLLLPAPAWFNAVDLLGAYLPMGYLGSRLAQS